MFGTTFDNNYVRSHKADIVSHTHTHTQKGRKRK